MKRNCCLLFLFLCFATSILAQKTNGKNSIFISEDFVFGYSRYSNEFHLPPGNSNHSQFIIRIMVDPSNDKIKVKKMVIDRDKNNKITELESFIIVPSKSAFAVKEDCYAILYNHSGKAIQLTLAKKLGEFKNLLFFLDTEVKESTIYGNNYTMLDLLSSSARKKMGGDDIDQFESRYEHLLNILKRLKWLKK